MSATMPWTQAMMDALADGEWHDKKEILDIGAALVPADRALEELGSRLETMPSERRIASGAHTVALQSLQGRRRFLAVQIGPDGRVRKSPHESVANFGISMERMAKLEMEVADLRVLVAQLVAHTGFEIPVVSNTENGSVDVLDTVTGE